MSLDAEQIKKIANLANLSLDDQEVVEQSKTLTSILDYISTLSELDTDDVEPLTGPLELSHVTREDIIKTSSEELLSSIQANYPDQEGSSIKVPRMKGA